MDLAYVDKLAKDNNGVKYLLVRQDLFDRTVDATCSKTKGSKETIRAFLTMITKQNRPKKIWVDRGTELAGKFKNLSKAEGIQCHSTMSEAKAAERTMRSRKKILYHYMEDNGYYKYSHKLIQFVTTLNSRRNCSKDLILIPKNVEKFRLFLHSVQQTTRRIRKPQFKIGDRVRISKYDLPFRKSYKPKFTRDVFETVAISSRIPPTYTIKDEQDEIIRGKFYPKELVRVI